MIVSCQSRGLRGGGLEAVDVAGSGSVKLPVPSVMTRIWPIPTITEKAAKVRAAWERPSELAPPVKRTVVIQTAMVAANDQIQGFEFSRRDAFIGSSHAFRGG